MNEQDTSNVTGILVRIVLCIGLYLILKHCWKRRWWYYHAAKIPGYSGLPFLGTLRMFQNYDDLYNKLFEFSAKFNPFGKLWIGSDLTIMVSDPELVAYLGKKYLAKAKRYDCLKPAFGEGILTAPVTKWKGHRHTINRTFKYNILCGYFPVFVKHANRLINDLKLIENTKTDVLHEFTKYTFAVVHESCMGVNSTDNEEYTTYVHSLMRGAELINKHMVYPLFQIKLIWELVHGKELNKIHNIFFGHARKVLDRKKAELKNSKNDYIKQQSFLNHLIKITDEDGIWSDNELLEETQTMIAAGSDTTAITLSFLFIVLAMHPEIQEKVYEEFQSIFEDGHVDVTLDDINRMVYFERVLKETLRLFPVAPYLMREISEDIKIGKYTFPKGAMLALSLAYIQRDPTWWPDPLKFDPDRFLPEEVAKRPRYAYIPFSVAPRNCVGFLFAKMSIKVVTATILRKYKISWTQYKSIEDIKLQVHILLGARDGYNITLTPRSNSKM